jgi:hypothetical protein
VGAGLGGGRGRITEALRGDEDAEGEGAQGSAGVRRCRAELGQEGRVPRVDLSQAREFGPGYGRRVEPEVGAWATTEGGRALARAGAWFAAAGALAPPPEVMRRAVVGGGRLGAVRAEV